MTTPLGLSRFAAEATPIPSQRPASANAASARSSPASARSASWATPAPAPSPALAQQHAERYAGLDAAAAAAGAQVAARVHGDVPQLAAEAARAAEQLAVDDDPGADAQLARDVDEVPEAAPAALPQLRERAEVRIVLGADRERGPAEPLAQQVGHEDVDPAEVGRHEQAAVAVDQAGQRDHGAGRQQLLVRQRGERRAGELGEVVEHRVDRPAAVLARRERLVALAAGQVDRPHGEVGDADLEPEPDDAPPGELDRQRGAPDRAAQLDLGLAHQPQVDQLGDQARDRGLVQAGLLRDRGAREPAAVGDAAQHDPEVVAAHRALVRRRAALVLARHDPTVHPVFARRCGVDDAPVRIPSTSP